MLQIVVTILCKFFLLFTFSKTAVKDTIAAGNSNVLLNFVGFYFGKIMKQMIWIKASLKRWGPRLEDRIFWRANAFRLMCLIQSTKKQKERVAHTVPWNKRRQIQTMRYPRSLPFRRHWTDYPLSTTLKTLFKFLKHFLVTIHGIEYKNACQIKLLK